MSSKNKKPALWNNFLIWFRGEHRQGPNIAEVALSLASLEWSLLRLKLAVRRVDFLIKRDRKQQEKMNKRAASSI